MAWVMADPSGFGSATSMSLPDWSNGHGANRHRFAKICTIAAP
jgi:hypothetical protein